MSNPKDSRKVVITGLGMITALGVGKDAAWSGIQRGKGSVRRLERFDASSYRCQVAAQADDFSPETFFGSKEMRRMDRATQMAVVAGQEAVNDAKLHLNGQSDRCGIYMGSALGGISFAEEQHGRFIQGGPKAVNPMLALSIFGGSSACHMAIALGTHGPVMGNANSCASGAVAIGQALDDIRRGRVDLALAGGVEAPLAPLTFGAFDLIGAMSATRSDTACRPFDRLRDGFVMGEGAAVLVLEEKESAVRRGARVYAELKGYASTADGHHMTSPRPDGDQSSRAMSLALEDAGVLPQDVSYVNAHGSSTLLNDASETRALKRVFGEWAYRIPVSSTKPFTGHALGASPAMEAAFCAMALEASYVPPTLHWQEPDPNCDLDYVPTQGRSVILSNVLCNAFGFGGINACLVLGNR